MDSIKITVIMPIKSFATKAFGHYIVPAYSLSASGDYGRGGGLGALSDFGQRSYLNEDGQRYNRST